MATIDAANIPLLRRGGVITDPNSANTSAVNTAAVVSLPARSDGQICLQGLEWSYNATPTGGTLTVDAGGVTLASIPIPSSGPGFLMSNYKAPTNTPVNVTLSAAGATTRGFVRVDRAWYD